MRPPDASVDLAAMVRDPRIILPSSERQPHTPIDTARPTAPPPDDKAYAARAQHGRLQSTVPPSGSLSQLEEEFVMPERRFFDRLEERARRAELLTVFQAAGLTSDLARAGRRRLSALIF